MSKQKIQDQMFEIVEACNASGLTRTDYCLKNNINRPRFYYWAKRYKEHQMASSGFIQIDSKQVLEKNAVIEIIFPNGVKIITNASASCNDLNRMVSCW
jgi:hypothetical protein